MTSTATELPVLGRQEVPAPPVRIVHLGLGAFHRSHQAWFTAKAHDASAWGIAAFTGRRPDAALALAPQEGLFTLIERAADGDRFEVVGSIAEAVDGADTARLNELLAAPSTAIVTLTVTEKVYDDEGPDTPLGRLARGLAARRDAGAGPIAVVSCDNVAGNGDVARAAVARIAEAQDSGTGGLAAWVRENVSFVGTSVDRITPRTTPRGRCPGRRNLRLPGRGSRSRRTPSRAGSSPACSRLAGPHGRTPGRCSLRTSKRSRTASCGC